MEKVSKYKIVSIGLVSDLWFTFVCSYISCSVMCTVVGLFCIGG